jgi:hypothetical protein
VEGLGVGTQLFELAGLLSLVAVDVLTRPRKVRTVRRLAVTCVSGAVAACFVFLAATLAAAIFQGGVL